MERRAAPERSGPFRALQDVDAVSQLRPIDRWFIDEILPLEPMLLASARKTGCRMRRPTVWPYREAPAKTGLTEALFADFDNYLTTRCRFPDQSNLP